MKITRENYAVFAIDYLDGTLSPEMAEAFLSFLDQHPDLSEEFSGLSMLEALSAEHTEMPVKELLKQNYDLDALNINGQNTDYYFIAYFEGDLTEAGMHNVMAFVERNPEVKNSFELFAKTGLQRDNSIVYPLKANLKKKAIVPLWVKLAPVAALAATILLLISVYFRIEPSTEVKLNEIIGGSEVFVASPSEISKSEGYGSENSSLENNTGSSGKDQALRQKSKETVKRASRDNELPVKLQQLPAQQITNNIIEPFKGNPRQKFTQIFDDIQLSQQLMLAQAENQQGKEDKPFNGTYGRAINRLVSTGAQVVTQIPTTFDPWLLADLGMDGFNMLTNNDLKIRRYIDQQGKTQKVQLIDRERNRKIFSSN